MDGSAFRVRGDTCDQFTKAIVSLKLHKNENGGCVYDDERFLEKQVDRELKRQYYENSEDGIEGLISGTTNNLNAILSTKLVSRASILKASKNTASAASTSCRVDEPEIKTNPDAQEEAD